MDQGKRDEQERLVRLAALAVANQRENTVKVPFVQTKSRWLALCSDAEMVAREALAARFAQAGHPEHEALAALMQADLSRDPIAADAARRACDVVLSRVVPTPSQSADQVSTVKTMQRWVDLAAHGIFLGDQKMADGKQRLVVLDMNGVGDPEALHAVGLVPFSGSPRYDKGIYFLQGDDQRLRPKALARAFGIHDCPLVEVERAQIDRVFREKTLEKFGANIRAVTMRSKQLGHNRAGLLVYEGASGRFVVVSGQNAVTEDSAQAKSLGAAAFLRAGNEEELRACAEGFLWPVRMGGKLNWTDVERFAGTVYERELNGAHASDEQLHRLQEAIEAAGYQTFMRLNKGIGEPAFALATDFYYGMPIARMRTAQSVFFQQYSTPMPMAVVAQRLLVGEDDVQDRTVLEPTAGNGGLVNLLPASMKLYGNELDGQRLAALRELGRIQVHQGDALNMSFEQTFGQAEGFDYTIANPPFGQMDEPRSFDKLPAVRRQDHYIALRTLAARRAHGRSVLIFGADSNQSDGTLKGGARNFLNYVHDHYEVHGVVELDGRMYARHGAGFNVRMMVVGDRRAEPVQAAVPEKLAILTSYEDLWHWADGLVKGYSLDQVPPSVVPEDELITASGFVQAPVFGEGGIARVFRGESTAVDVEADAPAGGTPQAPRQVVRQDAQPPENERRTRQQEQSREQDQPEGVVPGDETPPADESDPVRVARQEHDEPQGEQPGGAQAHEEQRERQQDGAPVEVPDGEPVDMGTLAAWQLSRDQWEQAIAQGDAARVAQLRFDVAQWARDKLAAHESGEDVLSEADLAEVIERINAPVTHRDVVEKALSEGLAVPAAVLADYPDIEFADDRRVNEFQAPYQPASRSGEASTMIPINMAGATYAALNALEARVGPVDEFVASQLQYPLEDLGGYFSPEQIDALGLGISAVQQGRGIINADMTGVGKGRYVAGLLRYAKLHGLKPIFLTIKPELFTDIFRDIGDIGSEDLFKNLFIFNDGVNIKKFGSESEVLYRATTPGERLAALSSGAVGEDVDLVLATYSQFQRAYTKNRKAQLLTELAANGGMMVLDEAHVAAGASNLGETVTQAVANSQATMYASATPLKGVENFGLYCKVFPASVDLKSLPDTLRTGGEALQEAISANMARDGVLIRRELDFSGLVFHTRNPAPEREQRNRDLADRLADIVSQLGYLAGDVTKMVNSLNKGYKKAWEEVPEQDRRGARMQASSMNFGSRLYSLNRQFLLGIKIEDAVQTALEALENGRKPVFAVENTGESLLRQVLSRRLGLDDLEAELAELDEKTGALTDEEQARREDLSSTITERLRNASLDSPPQYRELLEIMLDRIGIIKVQGRYGEVSRVEPDSKEYREAAEYLRKQIQAFPDLPLTPIDIIKKELVQRGFPVGEVSGRTASIVPQEGDASRWDVQFHAKSDAVANVAGFQNGRYEGIVITRSGSTGISLHATDRFEDSDIRQRDFIVVQKAANIAEFLQWMGRVNRKGQVVAPRITSLESGLPAELRLTMMHNAKLRKLSANTTSNRQSANLEGEEFDLLNDVGDSVALAWLLENPDVAHSLDIELPEDNEEDDTRRFSQDCPYVNKLMGRLMMVSVARQEEILRAITLRFADKLDELTQRGINPFKIDVFDWGARVEHEEELQSGVIRTSGSTFDEPIKLVTLKYEQEVTPIRTDRLKKMIAVGNDLYVDVMGAKREGVAALREQLLAARDGWVRRQLPAKLRESEEPLAEILKNADAVGAKGAFERASWLIDNLDSLRPGVPVVHEDMFQGERTGVITAVDFPSQREELFLLSKYRARVAFPGEDKVRDITLATVRNQDQDLRRNAWQRLGEDIDAMPAHLRAHARKLLDAYDSVPDGVVTRTQYVLRGNIFRACELASEQRLGSPVLFTDAEGNRQRAVLLKDRITPDMVKALPIGLDASDLCDYVDEYLDPANPKYQERSSFGEFRFFDSGVKDMKKGDGLMFEGLNGGRGFRFTIPGTKSRAGVLMSDGDIFDLGEKSKPGGMRLKLAGTRNYMQVDVTREDLPRLLNLLQTHRHVGKFYLPTPDHKVLGVLKSRYEQGKEVQSSQEVDMAP